MKSWIVFHCVVGRWCVPTSQRRSCKSFTPFSMYCYFCCTYRQYDDLIKNHWGLICNLAYCRAPLILSRVLLLIFIRSSYNTSKLNPVHTLLLIQCLYMRTGLDYYACYVYSGIVCVVVGLVSHQLLFISLLICKWFLSSFYVCNDDLNRSMCNEIIIISFNPTKQK